MNQQNAKVFRNTKWVADLLGKTPETVISYIHRTANPLPARKIGKEYLFEEGEVYAWIDQQPVVAQSGEELPLASGE